jgi:hypothetical protein
MRPASALLETDSMRKKARKADEGKKLRFVRETLKHLEDGRLDHPRGGMAAVNPNCSWLFYNTCQPKE